MPKTILNWKNPTSRPRFSGGAISAIYIGPSTDEAPIPRPPRKRATTQRGPTECESATESGNQVQDPGNAQAGATAIAVARDAAEHRAEDGSPQSAASTVTPRLAGVRGYVVVSAPVAPEMTAVSKPNSSPPRAATMELFAR